MTVEEINTYFSGGVPTTGKVEFTGEERPKEYLEKEMNNRLVDEKYESIRQNCVSMAMALNVKSRTFDQDLIALKAILDRNL